jgi:hypothetical protein
MNERGHYGRASDDAEPPSTGIRWPVVAAIGAAVIGAAYFLVVRPAKRGYEAQLRETKKLAAGLKDGDPVKRWLDKEIEQSVRRVQK